MSGTLFCGFTLHLFDNQLSKYYHSFLPFFFKKSLLFLNFFNYGYARVSEYRCVQFLQRPEEGRAVDLLELTSSFKLPDVGARIRRSVSTIAEPPLQPLSLLSIVL